MLSSLINTILISLCIQINLNLANDGLIDIQNAHSISKWWYQLIVLDLDSYTLSEVSVIATGANEEYVPCVFENWPPYPWTCDRGGITSYTAPVTVKLINTMGQELIIPDIIENFIGSARFNSTYSFNDVTTSPPTTPHPTTKIPTISPTYAPTTAPTETPSYAPTTSQPTTFAPTTMQPTKAPNTDPTSSPTTSQPTQPSAEPSIAPTAYPTTLAPSDAPTTLAPSQAPTGTIITFPPSEAPTSSTTTTTTTTTESPGIFFFTSDLQSPLYVGYINTVLCNTGRDLACLASIGLPGYTRDGVHHGYNVLNFGSYIISNSTGINALEFWFNPKDYLSSETIKNLTGHYGAGNNELRLVMHNIYAAEDIKILLSTFGEQDDDDLDEEIVDNWIERGINPAAIGSDLADIARKYWFDGVNINFDTEARYFNGSGGETRLIVLTNTLNSQLNRNSPNPYYIITHTVSSTLFAQSDAITNGGYLMLDEFCDGIISWYNIKFYDAGSITYNTFTTLFETHETSMDKLILGENWRNISVSADQIVIARGANINDVDGYLPAATFANIIEEAVTRESPEWDTGFMVYDFLSDEGQGFGYSLAVISAFTPTPEPTAKPTVKVTVAQSPTVKQYVPEDNTFDLLNLNSYGWGEWFFLITMFIIITSCCICIGCAYHRYRVKDRILTDEQIQDLEDEMNKTGVSDSWRRLSKLLVRSSVDNGQTNSTQSPSLGAMDPLEMNMAQATRVLGRSICTSGDDLEGDDETTHPDIELIKANGKTSVDVIPEDELEDMVGQSLDTNRYATDLEDDDHNFVPQPPQAPLEDLQQYENEENDEEYDEQYVDEDPEVVDENERTDYGNMTQQHYEYDMQQQDGYDDMPDEVNGMHTNVTESNITVTND